MLPLLALRATESVGVEKQSYDDKWVDPESGNSYYIKIDKDMVTVYAEETLQSVVYSKEIGPGKTKKKIIDDVIVQLRVLHARLRFARAKRAEKREEREGEGRSLLRKR